MLGFDGFPGMFCSSCEGGQCHVETKALGEILIATAGALYILACIIRGSGILASTPAQPPLLFSSELGTENQPSVLGTLSDPTHLGHEFPLQVKEMASDMRPSSLPCCVEHSLHQ